MVTRGEILMRIAKAGEKDVNGRRIKVGPRGGEYVMHGKRKIYLFAKHSEGAPTRRCALIQPLVNKKGRTVHEGKRGGRYVLSGSRKIYIK
jgi:hypothetical protein